MHADPEEWREIEDFPHYLISNHGQVMGVDGRSIRKLTFNDKGFPIVTLYGRDSKTRYLRQVNKLVASAFLTPSLFDEETSVWHIDGDLANCHIDNLRWASRAQVLEWNEMHRRGRPSLVTPRVKNNRTGAVYDNAYECGIAEGMLESAVVWRVERQAAHIEDDNARYRYVFGEGGRL